MQAVQPTAAHSERCVVELLPFLFIVSEGLHIMEGHLQKFEYETEGQVTENIGAMVFLIVGVGIATLVLIFVGVLGGQVYQQVEPTLDLLSGAEVNSSLGTVVNGTLGSFSHDDVVSGTLAIINRSTATSVPLTNFTIDYDAGTYTLIDNAYNNSPMNASFSWGDVDISNSIKGAIVSGFEALETTGNYLPIIVLAVIIFIVLSIVMGLGAFGGMGAGGATYGGAL